MSGGGRFLPALRAAFSSGASYDGGQAQAAQDRDAALAVSLARLETCARHRDPAAAARALDGMAAGSDDGAWLLLQMAAAGLRALSNGTQHLPPATVRTHHARGPASIVADPAGMTAAARIRGAR